MCELDRRVVVTFYGTLLSNVHFCPLCVIGKGSIHVHSTLKGRKNREENAHTYTMQTQQLRENVYLISTLVVF